LGHAFRLVAWLAVAVLLSFDSGCRPDPSVAKPVASIRLGYFANLSNAQGILAVASGELAGALSPVKLETRLFNAGPSIVEALFAGEIDVGNMGPGPAISASQISDGAGIRVIAGAASNGAIVVARKGVEIHTLSDLRGKTVATPQLGNTQDLAARHYLRQALNGDFADIVPIANAEQAGLFARGLVDAAWVPEPWGERLLEEADAKVIVEEKDLWPNKEFALALVVTTPEFLASHADLLTLLLRVHHAWTERLKEPETQVAFLGDALFALSGKRLPNKMLARAIQRVTYTDEPSEETLRAFAVWTEELGLARRKVEMSRLVDTSLLRLVTR
jgi:NitT/TauT family transport system substrate-binding protein